MAKEGGGGGSSEWKISFPDGTTSEKPDSEMGPIRRILSGFKSFLARFGINLVEFLQTAKSLAVEEPQKVNHCLKVELALSFVSLFYFMRPLYDCVGGNAMWALITVVVVLESTVGATLSKCVNRTVGTFLAVLLGMGVHWIANESGHQLEPIILGISVFLFASAATFSRFIPFVKAWFDYGAMIFILTFSLVSVSGYRTDKLVKLAGIDYQQSQLKPLCIIISMLVCPIWDGTQLHNLICHNLVKLSDSLEECVLDYFKDHKTAVSEEDPSKQIQDYKFVLNSKATEDAMYLKVSASMRSSAYCIETLNTCVNSEIQAESYMKKHLKKLCVKLSSSSSNVLKELTITLTSMPKSFKTDFLVGEMNFAVQELQNTLKYLPNNLIIASSENDNDIKGGPKTSILPVVEFLQLATVVSLLIENAARIEGFVETVEELAGLAEFKPAADKKLKQKQEHETMMALPEV